MISKASIKDLTTENNPFSNEFILGNSIFKKLRIKTKRAYMAHFKKQNELDAKTVIPPLWYSADGFLPPIMGGYVDASYCYGDTFSDIADFMLDFLTDSSFRRTIMNGCIELYHSTDDLRERIFIEAHEEAKTLLDRLDRAENQYDIGGVIFYYIRLQAVEKMLR